MATKKAKKAAKKAPAKKAAKKAAPKKATAKKAAEVTGPRVTFSAATAEAPEPLRESPDGRIIVKDGRLFDKVAGQPLGGPLSQVDLRSKGKGGRKSSSWTVWVSSASCAFWRAAS